MPPNDRETIANEERGCGFLDHSKGYVRSPPASESGVLPPFVEFDPPIPYLERSKFRGYEYFPGIPFELAVTGAVDVPTTHAAWAVPDGADDPRLQNEDADKKELLFEEHMFPQDAIVNVSDEIGDGLPRGISSTDPEGEIWRHIARLTGSAEGSHAGDVTAFHSHDLYMHIGASYYETPEEFIEEVHEQGLSKAIPVSESQEPPVINPGKTRLFLVHPNAAGGENDKPGVIGYVYLWRSVYTESEEGEFPHWAKKEARSRDDMDLVHVGDKVYEDGTRETTIDSTDEFGNGDDVETDPVSVQPSDKPGRDVESVPDDDVERLDEDEIRDQLDDAAEEIEEFEETTERVGEGLWANAELVEVPRPEECPECGEPTDTDTTEEKGDEVTVTLCPACGWDNWTEIRAALVESNLRNEDYNALQIRASERGVHPGGNPSGDALVRALLDDMGLI